MAENWIRYFRLTVARDRTNTQALDFSSYHVTFEISQATVAQPCTARIRIYNVSDATLAQIKGLGQRVIVEGGYQSHHGKIFEGNLVWKMTGRESQTETFVELTATSQWKAHKYAVVNVSLPAGTGTKEQLDEVVKSFKEKGATSAKLPEMTGSQLPRGQAIFAMARDVMDEVAETTGMQWGYTDTGIVAVPNDGRLKDRAIVINSQTGMELRPTVTIGGIQVKCRLNPDLEIGRTVQLDNSTIQRGEYQTGFGNTQSFGNYTATNQMISSNGLYKVLSRVHTGDNFGSDWTTTIKCEGVNASVTPGMLSTESYTYISNG